MPSRSGSDIAESLWCFRLQGESCRGGLQTLSLAPSGFNFYLKPVALRCFGEGKINGHRDQNRNETPKRGSPVAAGDQEMTNNGWGRPGHVYDRAVDEVPLHEQIGEGR